MNPSLFLKILYNKNLLLFFYDDIDLKKTIIRSSRECENFDVKKNFFILKLTSTYVFF